MIRDVSQPFSEFWRFKGLILRLCMAQFRSRHAGMALGFIWLFLFPALYIAIYFVVYNLVLKVRPTNMEIETYLLYIFSGLLTFLSVSETLSVSTSSLVNNEDMFKSTSFPLFIVPMISTLVAQITLVPGLIIMGALGLYWQKIGSSIVLLPLLLLSLTTFLCGISFFISLLAVVLKDLQRFITFISMGIMMSTPIVFTLDMVPQNLLPVIYLNPFYYFIAPIQTLFAFGEWPDPNLLALQVAIALGTYALGFWTFHKIKGFVSNYV